MAKYFIFLCLFVCGASYGELDPRQVVGYRAAIAEIEMDELVQRLRGEKEILDIIDVGLKADLLVLEFEEFLASKLGEEIAAHLGIYELEGAIEEGLRLDAEERELLSLGDVGHSESTMMLMRGYSDLSVRKEEMVRRELDRHEALIGLKTKQHLIREFIKVKVDSK